MQPDQQFARVKQWIVGRAKQDVSDDHNLISSGILDSMAVIELLGVIETERGARIPVKDLIPENFTSLSVIRERFFDSGCRKADLPAGSR